MEWNTGSLMSEEDSEMSEEDSQMSEEDDEMKDLEGLFENTEVDISHNHDVDDTLVSDQLESFKEHVDNIIKNALYAQDQHEQFYTIKEGKIFAKTPFVIFIEDLCNLCVDLDFMPNSELLHDILHIVFQEDRNIHSLISEVNGSIFDVMRKSRTETMNFRLNKYIG